MRLLPKVGSSRCLTRCGPIPALPYDIPATPIFSWHGKSDGPASCWAVLEQEMLLKMCSSHWSGNIWDPQLFSLEKLYHFDTPWALLAPALQGSRSPSHRSDFGDPRDGGTPWLQLGHPTVARDAWDLLRSCPGNQGTPRKPPGTHSTRTNTPIMAVDPPLLAKLPMSQPLALEGIQERWWQAWTRTNSWAGLSIMALIVPLMQAGKVTSPLCATPPCCFCFVFYLFLSL